VSEVTRKADWYRYIDTLFPSDTRSTRRCTTLQALAAFIGDLPDSHPLFQKLAQIRWLGGEAHERWLDEIDLELSHLADVLAADAQQATERLLGISNASLQEWRQTNRLQQPQSN